jgi:hypothetical protein
LSVQRGDRVLGLRDVAVRGVSRRAACAALAVGLLGACGGDAPSADDAQSLAAQVAYVGDAASRRAALVASLVNPANSYSALRLAHYASGDDDDWELLPAWNPRVAPVDVAALDGPAPAVLPAEARALAVPDEPTWQPGATTSLEALGEEAFFRYPAQLAPAVPLSRDLVTPYGLWLDDARGVGGLVWTETPNGVALAMSCAACHADAPAGRLVAGLPSRFDLGRMLVAAGASDSTTTARLLAWGPGRVDVTTSDGSVPERIGDLRPERWLSHLQYDATVRQVDLVSLAIRIETLIITSHGETLRPPRLVSLALAQYLWSLAAAQPAAGASSSAGGALFSARCAGCHAGAGFTGPPRALAEIGTDPTLGLSPARGTGFYRVPSLRGVSLRPSLLHDGTLPDLDAMFDPARLDDDYAGGARGAGAVRGHVFGLDLPAADRAALLDYLRAL